MSFHLFCRRWRESGGGGGALFIGTNGSGTAGSGGTYGGGGGACKNSGQGGNASTQCISGAGADGIIVITYTPSSGGSAPARKMRLFEGFKIKIISGRLILQ
jgi:hypothetical protein